MSPASQDPRPTEESGPTPVSRAPNPVPDPAESAAAESVTAPAPPSPPDAGAPPGQRRGIGRGRGRRGPRLVHHFKVDEGLAPDDRTAYEALLLDPRQTCDSLTAWLHARGYTRISRGAVHRHRRHFEQDVLEIRKSAKIAGQFSALARAQGGAGCLADASQFRLEQLFLERLFGMKGDDRLSGKEWAEFGKAMTALLDNRKRYESLRMEWEEKARRAAAELEKANSGEPAEPDVVARVKEILGV